MVSRRQIKHAIKILSQACDEDFSEFKQEMRNSIAFANQMLNTAEDKLKSLYMDSGSSAGRAQHFGFTEQYISEIKINHSDIVKNFITNWCNRQSDWRFPWCWLCPNNINYTELSVKSHLVYVCSNNISEQQLFKHVQNKLSKQAKPRMFRIKPYDNTGTILDHHVPFDQIGSVISLDLLPYLSLEQIQTLFNSINKILRNGGQALVHFADGDGDAEWIDVMKKKITYCNESHIQKFAEKSNLTSEFYHVDDHYSFAVLTKPGNKTSIKAAMTKIQPITSKTI